MVIRVLLVPPDFRALHYDRRTMLDERALPLVELLWKIDQKFRAEHPEDWRQRRDETDARFARKKARHIVRHEVAFAAARKGLIPGVDEIRSPARMARQIAEAKTGNNRARRPARR